MGWRLPRRLEREQRGRSLCVHPNTSGWALEQKITAIDARTLIILEQQLRWMGTPLQCGIDTMTTDRTVALHTFLFGAQPHGILSKIDRWTGE